MTIREWATNYCTERCMSDDDAKAAVEFAIAHDVNKAMEGRWDQSIDGYPPQMLSVLTVSLRRCVVEYIEENQPEAWYKAMFEVGGE